MKCPLMMIGIVAFRNVPISATYDCRGEECAWWHDGYNCCQFLELVRALGQIEFHLKEISNREHIYGERKGYTKKTN